MQKDEIRPASLAGGESIEFGVREFRPEDFEGGRNGEATREGDGRV